MAERRALVAATQLAAEQYGALDRTQALSVGLSPDAVRRLVAAGDWSKMHSGVFSLWTPRGVERRLQRLFAATLWLGEGAAVSHRAAAHSWQLDGVQAAPNELITVKRNRQAPGLIVRHVRALPCRDIVLRDKIRVTSAARTLIDLAAVCDASVLERAFECALRRKHTTYAEILGRLEKCSLRLPGRAILSQLLHAYQGTTTDSDLETLLWQILRAGGLPLPVRQFEVFDEQGTFVARIDLAYPEELIAIEADGYEHHSGRVPFQRDRTRQNRLTSLGWAHYRVTWDDVRERPGEIVGELAALLAARSKLRP